MQNPFPLFEQFADRLTVAFFAKSDTISKDLEAAKALRFAKSAGVEQVHGDQTIIVRDQLDRTTQADGMLTDIKNILLVTRAADCQQIIVYAPKYGVCGALHAGWRGLVNGTISSFYRALHDEWSIAPEETFVGIGPSLCLQHAEFSEPESELEGIDTKYFDGRHADLQKIATDQLLTLGVSHDCIERHPDCTYERPETYWTYRGGDREKVLSGMTNFLCIGMR